MYSLLPLCTSLNTNEPSTLIYLNNQLCLSKCRQLADALDVVLKGEICTTNTGDNTSPYLCWAHSTYSMSESKLWDLHEKSQRVLFQIECQSVQGCSQKNGELSSHSSITSPISRWVAVIGNGGVKCVTCHRSGGKSTINIRFCPLLQTIIINGTRIAICTELFHWNVLSVLPVLSWKNMPRTLYIRKIKPFHNGHSVS